MVNLSNQTLGSLIKAARTAKKLSARELSLKAGVSQSYISKVEADLLMPTLAVFSRLAIELNLSNIEIIYIVKLLGTNGTTKSDSK